MVSRSLGRLYLDAADPTSIDVFGKLKYKPTPKQQEFHDATEYDVVFGGSRGSGKSVACLLEGIRQCVWHPGLRVLALRRTFAELKSTLLAELARYGFARKLGATWNGTDHELKFPNGSVLKLGYCDSLVDTSQYQGTSWGLLIVDELTLMLPGAVEILRETLRSGDEGASVIGIRSSCNPGGPSHTAIKTNYVEATEYGAKVITDDHGRSVRYIPARVTDNPHVGEDYVKVLEAIPDPARRKAMLDGDWSAFAGAVFAEWSQARHVVPRNAITLAPSWRRYVGIDWGFAAPWAVIWGAIDNDGRAWIYRELYLKGVGPADQAERIMTAERKAGETEVVHFIDPSTVAKATGGLSVHELYAIAGLGCALAVNDRLAGWQTLHSYLADGPLCPVHQRLRDIGEWSGDTCPRLHVLEGTAPNLVRTLPDLPYDPNRVEDVLTTVEDHCLVAGTLVLTRRGEVPIETVTLSDEVLTRVGWRRVRFSGRTATDATVGSITLYNGTVLRGTGKHPVWTDRGWIDLDALELGDRLTTREPGAVAPFVVARWEKDGIEDVFNLTVEDDHEFYANGVLVLNCSDALRYLLHSLGATAQPIIYDANLYDADSGNRRLSVVEMGGPEPMPSHGTYVGDMRSGLAELGVSFEREDGSTPGATQRSPFA